MTMNGTAPVKAAIWARVSTTDQHTENQVHVLREWAQKRGFAVVAEFVTEDSAWGTNGAKGKEFDRQRRLLVRGAKQGDYQRVLIWALDRLSRRGIKDTIGVLEDLDDAGAVVCSHQEEWLETGDPRMRELIISVMAWMAQQESARRSERIRNGIARRRRDIEEGRIDGRIGGGKKGRKMPRVPLRANAAAGWEGEQGERRREALIARNKAGKSPAALQREALERQAAENITRLAPRKGQARPQAKPDRDKMLADITAAARAQEGENNA